MYCDCSMERVLASMSWWMHMPRTQDVVLRSEDLKQAPMESWRESSRHSLFPASSLSSTYTGIMTMEWPHSKMKTEWSACMRWKPIQIRKAWSVAYHSCPACFSPYRPFLSLATFISFPWGEKDIEEKHYHHTLTKHPEDTTQRTRTPDPTPRTNHVHKCKKNPHVTLKYTGGEPLCCVPMQPQGNKYESSSSSSSSSSHSPFPHIL